MTTTRALLLTDVVDSTKLSEALGDAAMAELWARHDRVARDLLPLHHGREIDKTDGFLMLFTEAADAVAYAVAYHSALRDLGIAARAGLHVGPVILTENAPADVARGAKPLEVDGIAKPTAARVMSVATGGQTLLTPSAVQALGDTELRLESHGHWRMKGVAEPIELFEVGDEDSPFQPPPDAGKVYRVVERDGLWLPVREVKHSLPAERDAFVGRSADLQALHGLLRESRLVSVLGIGGTGKTRLVTRYGWAWLGDFPGGVWFCDLSEARSLDGIVSAVARALDVPLGRQDPVVHLGHALAGRGPCLVILDNFEQVARFAPDTVGPWLDRAAQVRFVVTTREVLGLPGETALPLAPLVSDESVDLFVTRARQAKPGFEPTDTASIEALVALLDHLPLALELAAARVRVMPPETLLDRMSQRFKLLASRGGRHTRQATLRAALDWSWDLLEADEQAALAQLSVFEGGFTLDAAEGVLELQDLWPMDAVQALVDKSLVRQVAEERFDLLVSVQEYAAEKLEEQGNRHEVQRRHREYFASFGTEEALRSFATQGETADHKSPTNELDNLVTACRRGLASGDAEHVVALLGAASAVLEWTGPAALTLDLATRAAAMSGLTPPERARCEVKLGEALGELGRHDEARTHYETALAAYRNLGHRSGEAHVRGNLGTLHFEQGRPGDARTELEHALGIAREVGADLTASSCLHTLANLSAFLGRAEEARELYDAAVTLMRAVGARRSEGRLAGNLGVLALSQGQLDQAATHFEHALAAARERGDRSSEGKALAGLGSLYLDRGRLEEARAQFEAALQLHREIGDLRRQGVATGNLGVVHALRQQYEAARAKFEAALALHRTVANRPEEGRILANLGQLHLEQGRTSDALCALHDALDVVREVGDRRTEGSVLGHLGQLYARQDRPDEARAHLEDGERLLRAIGDTLECAKLLCTRARLEASTGHTDAARALLAKAQDLAERTGATSESELWTEISTARAALAGP